MDNKGILAVCEQLNIAVKSHSSTITETEAERIRAAAEKYSAAQAGAAKPTAEPSGGIRPVPSPSKEVSNRPIVQKNNKF
ncbi:translation initiation factor IF-2 N-terminal domain-containing protein [Neosynechococcus sphagnicola]|uniref:translation initiation factor IF-2 N-terminal domain-containing protein n=1 Tax=Neosynechococcus sphagnicola TaxID=1501145 RepID=UPI001872210D|nr:translation initiation factor IF-2 N-terminal domain-containing protein [Neosynechococcus sphagnicola]